MELGSNLFARQQQALHLPYVRGIWQEIAVYLVAEFAGERQQ
jgi:hypothetical protein